MFRLNCDVPSHVEAVDVAGALNCIGTAQLSEEGFVSPGHAKAVEELLVRWVPATEGADYER